jgi:hypothetical protein
MPPQKATLGFIYQDVDFPERHIYYRKQPRKGYYLKVVVEFLPGRIEGGADSGRRHRLPRQFKEARRGAYMAEIKRLVETDQLKTGRLTAAAQRGEPLYFHYNRRSDNLMLLIVPRTIETVVHYIDDHIALLYEPDTLEVVGFQVEALQHSFLPNNPDFRNAWLFSESGEKVQDLQDLSLIFERKKREVARELIHTAENMLGHNVFSS